MTGLKFGGERILIAFDMSASMLDDTIVNVLRRRNMADEQKKAAPKWVRTIATVEWLAAQLQPDSHVQIIGFNESVKTMADGTEGRWIDISNSIDLERAIDAMKAAVPAGGTNLDYLATAIAAISPAPDNIYIVTDGLPTRGNGGANGATVSGRQRMRLFDEAFKEFPRKVPINVIMFPLEGDPLAPGEFWRLAHATGGTYLSPSRDWLGAGFQRSIAADSDYVVFVIDTSGSMFLNPGVWPGVMKKLSETLSIYPALKGIQVMSDQGDFMFPSDGGNWIADSPDHRRAILERMRTFNPYSTSCPPNGIEKAVRTFEAPDKRISVYVFGDDFACKSIDEFVDAVDRVNAPDEHGQRPVRINVVGFPHLYKISPVPDSLYRFAAAMRALTFRNNGTFVGLDSG